MKEGYKPDLALVDIDFQNLDSTTLKEKGFSSKKEKTDIRGFELIEAIRSLSPKTKVIAFTAHSSIFEINKGLKSKGFVSDRSYFTKSNKGEALQCEVLERAIPGFLQDITQSIFLGLTDVKKKGIREVIHGFNNDDIILKHYCPQLNGRKLNMEKMLIGWIQTTVNDDDTISMSLNNFREIVEQLIRLKPIEEYNPVGIFRKRIISDAYLDYSQLPDFISIQKKINDIAAEITFRICKGYIWHKQHDAKSDPENGYYFIEDSLYSELFIDITQFNCSNIKGALSIRENFDFFEKFKRLLIARRVVLGLGKIRDEKLTLFTPKAIISFANRCFGRSNSRKSTNNERQFLNNLLGLQGSVKKTPQVIYWNKCYEEEKRWLNDYIHVIVKRLLNNNDIPFM